MGLEVVSVIVPPWLKVSIDRKGLPSATPVLQSRGWTVTVHEPCNFCATAAEDRAAALLTSESARMPAMARCENRFEKFAFMVSSPLARRILVTPGVNMGCIVPARGGRSQWSGQ